MNRSNGNPGSIITLSCHKRKTGTFIQGMHYLGPSEKRYETAFVSQLSRDRERHIAFIKKKDLPRNIR